MTRGALVVTAALTLLYGSSADGLRVSLHATADAYLAAIAQVAPIAGRDTTYDYFERLNDDIALLDDPSVPKGYTATDWSAMVASIGALDVSLAKQLLARSFVPMSSIRGLGESFFRSSKDGTMQPVAVYVPRSYNASRSAPLVVLLHGHPQSETQLLAPPYIARLAELTGTIVVAPWGRGYYDFRGSASDVYDALQAAENAFSIDPRRRFLAGYSMGGFSVFEVAPIHAGDWSAVMCIAGALLGSDSERVIAEMRRTPFYVLTGSADESIPTTYPAATAAFLQTSGLDVSFYSQPGGTHRLVTILPILTQDMRNGIVRVASMPFPRAALPATIPAMLTKP